MRYRERDRAPAVWTITYFIFVVLGPPTLAGFLADLEGGYGGAGQLAPGFGDFVFFQAPAFLVVVMALHFALEVLIKRFRALWLGAVAAIALVAIVASPVQRGWCAVSHVCWVA